MGHINKRCGRLLCSSALLDIAHSNLQYLIAFPKILDPNIVKERIAKQSFVPVLHT